ncbi:MAG: hypothetical protein NW241_10805 [Bacteroidia bacterium]|nr:hypothetical protein [Bacteroidia bacterium]
MKKPRKAAASGSSLKAWLKYAPQHATTLDGAVTLHKPYRSEPQRQGELNRLLRHIAQRISEGRIWQARIYEQPGNRLLLQWSNLAGCTAGAHYLGSVQQMIRAEDEREQTFDALREPAGKP